MGAARKLDISGRKSKKRFSNLLSVRPQDQSWLLVVRLGNTFRISVTENRTQNWRNGEIRVTGPGVTTRIVQMRIYSTEYRDLFAEIWACLVNV